MEQRDYGVVLLFILAVIVVAYMALGVMFAEKTGFAYASGSGRVDGIYTFLTIAKNYPQNYDVVVGRYATDYEKKYGQEIAQYLGTKYISENDADMDTNLIVIGTPRTNYMTDKLLLRSYSANDLLMEVTQGNLLIVMNDERQARRARDTIVQFEKQKEMLSPPSTVIKLGSIAIHFFVLLGMLLGIGGVYIEKHRKRNISRAQETSEEHKLESLEGYIQKYTSQGYSQSQVAEWLVNYGYDAKLVEKASEAVNHA